MSSTGRSDIRQTDDFYRTPTWLVHAILRECSLEDGSIVLDPCCGDGAILDAVRERYPKIVTRGIELSPERANACAKKGHRVTAANALSLDCSWPPADVIIQNTPYRESQEFLDRAIRHSPTVVSLHRLGFLASQKRAPFWRSTHADVYITPTRPSFSASVKCTAACGFKRVYDLNATIPNSCPNCRSRLSVTRSDSCDYAWIVFSPNADRRWHILDVRGDAP